MTLRSFAYHLTVIVVSAVVSAVATPASAAEFRGLAEELSRADFSRAGLDKLTPEELATLDRLLRDLGLGVVNDGDSRQAAAAAPDLDAELEAAEAAARSADAEAAAALASARAAEERARARAEEAKAREQAAEAAAADQERKAAEARAREEALAAEPFQDGRWVGPKPKLIEAKIKGEFEGWRGDSFFVLDNGQVWKQRLDGKYFHRADSPRIAITRNLLGFFVLEVVDTGKKIGVKRVR